MGDSQARAVAETGQSRLRPARALRKGSSGARLTPSEGDERSAPPPWLPSDTIALLLLVGVAAAMRFWQLGKPAELVFDELHFVSQARHYLHGLPFLDPHPPLAKLLIAVSILAFGDHPWSWRLPNAIAGTALVGITYLLGRRMFGSRRAAALAAAFVMCDGLFLVDSRIAVLDIVYLTFAAWSYLLLFRALNEPDRRSRRRTLLWLGIALGCCLASKLYIPAATFLLVAGFLVYSVWAGRSAAEARQTDLSLRGRRVVGALALVTSVSAIVYLAVFVPYVLLGWWGGIADLFHYYELIVAFERTVSTALHPSASPWWSWPLMLRPVAYWQDFSKAGDVSTIWAAGNPASWWGAIAAILILGAGGVGRGTIWRAFLATGYLVYLIIWLPVGRTLFIYHYMPSVYLAYLALAVVLDRCWTGTVGPLIHLALLLTLAPVLYFGLHGRWGALAFVLLMTGYAAAILSGRAYGGKLVFAAFVAAVATSFAYFLPLWVAIPIGRNAFYARMWLQGPGLSNWVASFGL